MAEQNQIYNVFVKSKLEHKYVQCRRYVNMLTDPDIKPWFPLTEHAIYSIIDTAFEMFDSPIPITMEKLDKSRKFESSLRKAIQNDNKTRAC